MASISMHIYTVPEAWQAFLFMFTQVQKRGKHFYVGGWGGYHNREIVLPCLLACTHTVQYGRFGCVNLSSLFAFSLFLVFNHVFCAVSVFFRWMSRGFCVVVRFEEHEVAVCTCFHEESECLR